MPLRVIERRIEFVRIVALPFAAFQVAAWRHYPAGGHYALAAWVTTGFLAAAAAVFYPLTRREWTRRGELLFSLVAQVVDTTVVSAYVLIYYYDRGTPTSQVLYITLIAASVRFRTRGGLVAALASAPVLGLYELLQSRHVHGPYRWDFVTLQVGLELLVVMIIGWLVDRLAGESERVRIRAEEAEGLRDELGRRADLLDAANRCARALGSSLELSGAFGAFIRELRGLLPFDRVAIVLADEGIARVMAAAGERAEEIFPTGSESSLAGTLLEDVLTSNQPVYRPSLDPNAYPEEAEFVELGLGSRLAAPLVAGARTIGMLSVVRRERDAFDSSDIELIALLGRLVASAAQNINAYESERQTVEELRRLSTLRADFVSLVSHELRSPMSAVIGAARTLQARWPDLSPTQRESFLALIADETGRLATLVGDVLDTSRIDAGTFPYSFDSVDVGALVGDAVTTAGTAQAAVTLVAHVDSDLPRVRGDASRLRQVLANLLDNAIKYSPEGTTVEVRAASMNGAVVVDVVDRGSGIETRDQRLIFEKFGRVRTTMSKPGTGLGLYIARSIAEAHGGALEVDSEPGRGSTFTLRLPAG
ncbi:MAG: GAF domain-containing protein [Actinobacteria bacterium]|nr:GAF domain-containing protein [Actinomycetota bacterium]